MILSKRWIRFTGIGLISLAFVCLHVQTSSAAQAASSTSESKASDQPVLLDEVSDALYGFVSDQLRLSSDDISALAESSRFFEVDLGRLPQGYARAIAAFAFHEDMIDLVLFAADENADKFKLLGIAESSDQGDALFVNTAKLDLSTSGSRLLVWSQWPFSASESNAELDWNGTALTVVSHDYADPSFDYFEKKRQLLQKKDLEGMIRLDQNEDAMYPMHYPAYFELPGPVLLLSQQKALAAYKKDLKSAIRYLQYGLDQYDLVFGTFGYDKGTLLKSDVVGNNEEDYRSNRLSLKSYVAALNDYAYFLSLAGRDKEAKPILANVIKLVPDRIVAYLNLADSEWNLGQRTAAKAHYKQYLKLLGSKAVSVAPKRVQERIRAK